MPGQRGAVPVPLQDGPTDITQLVLDTLETKDNILTSTEFPLIPRSEVKAALDRLASRSMVQYQAKDTEIVLLTDEGKDICDGGSHEWKVWRAVKEQGRLEMKDLLRVVGDSAKVGQGTAMKNKWIKKEGSALVAVHDAVEDATRSHLRHVRDSQSLPDPKMLADYKKRKLVTPSKAIDYAVEKGPKYQREMPIEVTDLTADMLADGSWQTANFKPYNFDALGGQQSPGALHPLLQMRSELRDIFLRDGFVEMPTTRFAESGFWNFDALFVPQQHPARDMQDTFYLSDPASADRPRADPEAEEMMDTMEARTDQRFGTTGSREPRKVDYDEYWERVWKVHEGKDTPYGSIGYRYSWNEEECLKLCLRTHTTATSSWVLHRLAARPRPAKYFSIDRVFRNESVDATHLAEFHQVEGVIADWNLSLPDGMGFLEDFFGQLGLGEIKFKPAYNPCK